MAKKRSVAAVALAAAMFWAATSPALAAGPNAGGPSTVGECVAMMAPERATASGSAFADCVRMMAKGTCPHTQ